MAEKKPNIRFKGFEEEWQTKPLGELGEFKSNGVDKKISPEEIPVNLLNYLDVYNKINVTPDNCDELMQVTAKPQQLKENDVRAGDIFFTPTSETPDDIGHVKVIDEDLPNTVYSYHLMRFRRSDNTLEKKYPEYALETDFVRKQMFLAAQGAQRFVINKPAFEQILIRFPEYAEQQKIGEFFKQLDELIGAKEQELEKLHQMKLALLDKMFPSDNQDNINRGGKSLIFKILQNNSQLVVSSPAPNTPTIRFRGFTEPWVKYPISHRVTYGKGRGYSKASLQQSGTPILLYGTLYTDYNTNITEVNRYSAKKDWAVMSKGKEVVVPASGETAEDIARASAILKAGIILGGDLNIIYPDDNLDASFLALELTYGNSHRKLVKKAQGISVVHLHNTDISELEINVPSYNEQRKIGDFFRSQDEAIANSRLQINKLKTIKQACLSQMFA